MGQQHYSSHPARGNGRNGDRGPGDPPCNSRYYPHGSDGGHGGPYGTPGGVDGGPPMILIEVVQIVPLILTIEEDVDMISVLNNMSIWKKV